MASEYITISNIDEARNLLADLTRRMEQAESVDDCLCVLDDVLEHIKNVTAGETKEPSPLEDDGINSIIPAGSYTTAYLGNAAGTYHRATFNPINVNNDDTLQITWHASSYQERD